MTPLRQRFIDDLRLKNFSDDTIKVYVHAVKKFALFLGRAVCHDNLKIHARVLASLGIEGHWPAKLVT